MNGAWEERFTHIVPPNVRDEIGVFLDAHPSAHLYLVGGSVRDAVLGRTTKDIDLVVTKTPVPELERWLARRGRLDLTGQVFRVYKFLPASMDPRKDVPMDIALHRKERAAENSVGGYRDFDVSGDDNLPIEEDLARRDFTINAMAWDLREKRLIDPWHGLQDLGAKLIRAVGNPEER